jgi:hypothetical protein
VTCSQIDDGVRKKNFARLAERASADYSNQIVKALQPKKADFASTRSFRVLAKFYVRRWSG